LALYPALLFPQATATTNLLHSGLSSLRPTTCYDSVVMFTSVSGFTDKLYNNNMGFLLSRRSLLSSNIAIFIS
jgi:hypothetical protein